MQMGFLPPVSDMGSGTDCGGDPRLDIYLMHFNAADGDTATENCKTVGPAQQCSSFGLVEARLETIYPSYALGAHIVIAHELFHSVQNAYDAGLDRFWAEGTAQWAAKTIYPSEMDFEANLPAFFKNVGQSIDIAGGGVVAEYLYGAAIWPEFLSEHVGPTAVRSGFEQEGKLGPPSMHAIDVGLGSLGSSLTDAYPTFVAWNAATGARAGTGGYMNAKTYPEATLTPFPASNSVSDIGTGYASFLYSFNFGTTTEVLTLSADATRLGARTFPLVNGKARIDQITTLPATVTGTGVVVVAGISAKKSDAPFTLTAGPPMPDAGAPDAAAMTDAGTDAGSEPPPTAKSGCGCEAARGSSGGPWALAMALLGAACVTRGRRARERRSPAPIQQSRQTTTWEARRAGPASK
jgi:MYXO-CTERM domain-containing protein